MKQSPSDRVLSQCKLVIEQFAGVRHEPQYSTGWIRVRTAITKLLADSAKLTGSTPRTIGHVKDVVNIFLQSRVLSPEFDCQTLASELALQIDDAIAYATSSDWIACVPLESEYSAFPPLADFGGFTVINAAGGQRDGDGPIVDSFVALLRDHKMVTWAPSAEVDDSYLAKARQLLKTEDIPRGAQLVVDLGNGGIDDCLADFQCQCARSLAFLSYCTICIEQATFSLILDIEDDISDAHHDYLCEINPWPAMQCQTPQALFINKRDGKCCYFEPSWIPFPRTDYPDYPQLDYRLFRRLWDQNLARLSKLANNHHVDIDWIVRAVVHIGRQRSLFRLGMPEVSCTIAIAFEHLLLGGTNSADLAERFRLLFSRLYAADDSQSAEAYASAKAIYEYRSGLVHRVDYPDVNVSTGKPKGSKTGKGRTKRSTTPNNAAAGRLVGWFDSLLGRVLDWCEYRTKCGHEVSPEELFMDLVVARNDDWR